MMIGFDASRAFIKERTGTEEYSFQLLKSLAKIDTKNRYIVYVRPSSSVIATPRSGEAIYYEKDRHVANTPRDDGYKWPKNFHFKEIKWSRLWTQGGLSVETFKDKLDVLFIPAHTLPLIRKPGLKTVVTVHDLGSQYLPKTHQLKQRLYLAVMQRHQLKGATKLIAVSKATKEDLVKKIGIKEEKISVVYEGYDQDLFKPISSDRLRNILRYYDIDPYRYFLFVGTVQPRKNLKRLIKAFTEYSSNKVRSHHKKYDSFQGKFSLRSNNKLVIVGKKGWLADEIYALPKRLGIEKRVKFVDYVKKEDLPALYSGAVALISPSLFEGFGLPILEAQACGCPVLTSNVSSMPEIAGSGAILVDPYNIDDIVKGMGRLQVSGYREQSIRKGFENIKKFSWEKCAQDTLKVLEGVVHGKS